MRLGMAPGRFLPSAKTSTGLNATGLRAPGRSGSTEAAAEQAADQTARAVMRDGRPPTGLTAPGARDAASGPSIPSVAREAVQRGGMPLDPASRRLFEPRFGRDLSDVRIHAGPEAAASARALNARAYTVGRDIVFGANQYRPGGAAETRLMAHELAHVVRRDPAEPVVRRDAMSGEARPFVDGIIQNMETRAAAIRFDTQAPRQANDDAKVAKQIGVVEKDLDSWLKGVTDAEAMIKTSLQGDAALTTRLRTVYQDAVEAAVGFEMSRGNKTRHEVFQALRDKIAEWAWPKSADEQSANELTSTLTDEEQHNLTVITSSVVFDVNAMFSTKTARMTVPLPDGVAARFSSGVPQKLQAGLRNVAGTLIPRPLVLNSTMVLDLDRFGGDYGAYRFTYVEHRPKKGPATQEVLIERLGGVGVEGLTKDRSADAQKKFDAHGFKRDSSWDKRDAEFESVLGAVALIPDKILTPVDGITFVRGTVSKDEPDAGADYAPDKHAINVYDRAYQASTTRFGSATGLATDTVRAIAHEIGHAIDGLPLRQAVDKVKQAKDTFTTEMAPYETSEGSGNYSFPGNVQGRFNTLKANITKAEQAELKVRTESGKRDVLDGDTFKTVDGPAGADNIEFRKAALQDSSTRLTAYSNKAWGEYYAEVFSLYIADPSTLQRLRPNVYAFFVKNHPKTP